MAPGARLVRPERDQCCDRCGCRADGRRPRLAAWPARIAALISRGRRATMTSAPNCRRSTSDRRERPLGDLGLVRRERAQDLGFLSLWDAEVVERPTQDA